MSEMRLKKPLKRQSSVSSASLKVRNHHLCERLLNEVKDSVTSFKPSRSLAMLAALNEVDDDYEPGTPIKQVVGNTEIDLVISGGGLKGYFVTGCSHILKSECRKRGIKIARIAGASAGAWAGMLMLCDVGTNNWIETYYACQDRYDRTMHESYQEIWPWMQTILPEDAYLRCTDKLFISVTEIGLLGWRNVIVSKFESNFDLFQACMASSTVPFITEKWGCRKFRGKYVLDGGLTNNVPIFPDGLRRQLVLRLFDVDYPLRLLVNPRDSCIESLVLRGAIMMVKFLQGEHCENREIAWVEKESAIAKASVLRFVNPLYYLQLLTVPLSIVGIMATSIVTISFSEVSALMEQYWR